MNRSLTVAAATLAVLLSSAAAALATPTVSVGNGKAVFSDSNGSNADQLTVTLTKPSPTFPNSTDYTFTDNAPMSFGPGCTPENLANPVKVTCTVPNGTGVTVDLGGAPNNGPQTVQLTGSNWTDQTSALTGGPGPDSIIGAGGTDTLDGAGGADELDGGSGTDTASYASQSAPVSLYIDDSPDSGTGCPGASCEGDQIDHSIENLVGGSGDDNLNGDDDKNVLNGGPGNDVLSGGAEADTLLGDAGDDVYRGGGESDLMNETSASGPEAGGQSGSDTLDYSQDGRARGVDVNLDAGIEQEYQGSTEDHFVGVANVQGTNFRDILTGDAGANRISGLGGDDTLMGEAHAPSGSGTFAGGDDVQGGDGTDLFRYDDRAHDAGVTVTLDDKANDGVADVTSGDIGATPEQDNIHSDVENLVGGLGADYFAGSAAANDIDSGDEAKHDTVSYAGRTTGVVASLDGGPDGDTFHGIGNLEGGDGDDTLLGNADDNTLSGGGGNDTLRGGGGKDTLLGGPGSDTSDYSFDSRSQGVDVDLSTGQQRTMGGGDVEDTLTDVENVIGTQWQDNLAGDNNNNFLRGGRGPDTLNGRVGDDTLDPGTGGDGGSDGSPDTILGGTGSDTVWYFERTANVQVTLDNKADDGTGAEHDNVAPNVENAIGGGGNDTITADTSPSHLIVNNTFNGGAGNDTISGLAGDDTLIGGLGKDTVSGDDGNDNIQMADGIGDAPIDCGAGDDTVEMDQDLDTADANCETVKRVVVPVGGAPGKTGGGGPNGESLVAVDNPSVKEGNSGTAKLVFTVRLDAAQASAITVPFHTADLTAKAGEDYTAENGTLTFAAGQVVKTITVAVKGDKKIERDEQLTMTLGTPTGPAVLGSAGTAIGTILNDDLAPKKRPRLTAVVGPKRDRTAPYSFVVTGRLVRPKGVSAARGCRGRVRVQAKVGKRVLRRATRAVDNTCHYTVPIKLKNRRHVPHSGKVKLTVRFLGNSALRARSARTLTVRAG